MGKPRSSDSSEATADCHAPAESEPEIRPRLVVVPSMTNSSRRTSAVLRYLPARTRRVTSAQTCQGRRGQQGTGTMAAAESVVQRRLAPKIPTSQQKPVHRCKLLRKQTASKTPCFQRPCPVDTCERGCLIALLITRCVKRWPQSATTSLVWVSSA